MDPTAWTVIGATIVLLVAIAAAFRPVRAELREQRRELNQRMDDQAREFGALSAQMQRLEMALRECMAKVEGLLEGLREAITGRRAA